MSRLPSARRSVLIACTCTLLLFFTYGVTADSHSPNLQAFPNSTGTLKTFSSQGSINLSSAFFQNLGTNSRTCATCHQPSDGWGITPEHVQARFDADGGLDPIFRPVDGAVCPTADVSTVDARRQAYSMLLTKGLIRVSMPVPANAAFTLESIDDPYNCATPGALALFRRPLPSTNLRFLSTVMWDGRETAAGQSIVNDLASQANDATLGHAQAAVAPTAAQIKDIVDFEMSLTTAQATDNDAGNLDAEGGNGGPQSLVSQEFFLGINDPLGLNPTGKAFDSSALTMYQKWANLSSSPNAKYSEARAAVARGEVLFNTLPIPIEGVAGINDVVNQQTVLGTCTTCHDSPNVGDHSLSQPLNIGLTDASRRTPDMPLYTFRCNLTGKTIQTTDPGRALVTGRCEDIGKFKGAILRGLASRAPYFHNGSAATLMDVVEFYNTRFNLQLNSQQKSDLVAFLKTL